MSGTPIWQITDPSTISTIEWMRLCGCSTTSMRSGGRSNSQRASITSSPLFISVALSMLIFFPISQTGCFRACSGVTWARSPAGVVRNGPPEAVRMIRRTSAKCSPRRHWCTAECSLSTGTRRSPRSPAA